MKAPGILTGLLFPKKCLLCGRLLEHTETMLCVQCAVEASEALTLKRRIPFLSGVFALWYYEDHVRDSLLRFKFGNRRSYARHYGALLATKLTDRQEQFDLITWVPVSRRRKLHRGYDQVELIARSFGKHCGQAPVRCLKKIRHNPPQSTLVGLAARRANVLGAYRAVEASDIAGKRILLLDDIITTGATIGECARVLMTAGAKEVYGVAVAAARQHKHQTSR